MNGKSVWETVGISEVFASDSRGKIILHHCIDIFNCISQPYHPEHLHHYVYSRDTLHSILSILTADCIEVLADTYGWDKELADSADILLEEMINEKTDYLMTIVYRKSPRHGRKTRHRCYSVKDAKMSSIIATLFDFEAEAEEYVQAALMAEQYQGRR